MNNISICALYHFADLNDFKELRQPLLNFLRSHDIKGTILLAEEGINGTIAGSKEDIEKAVDYIKKDKRLANLSYKLSEDDKQPFYRLKVKLKKEIVTLGVKEANPNICAGTYIKPNEWNKLISDPDVIVVDTRNNYEVSIGTFKNAVNPNTTNFRELPEFVAKNLDKEKHKKVAMFCTGGIRCEKSTALLKSQGFHDVYHLEGGILKYLEDVPKEESMWEGECFVFDNRVSVDHELNKGKYDQCFACRIPLSEEDKKNELYEQGISCHHCYDKNKDQRERFKERQKQLLLSKERGEAHIGQEANDIAAIRRVHKKEQRAKMRLLNQ